MRSETKHRPPFPEKVTSGFLALLMTVFPLYTGFGGYQSITSAKYGAFLLLCGGYVALMALLGIELCLMGQAKLPKLRNIWKQSSLVQRLIALFLLCTVLSSVFSTHGVKTMIGLTRYEGLLTIALYCLCFLLVSVFGKPQPWMIYLVGVTTTLFCLLCILQLLGYNPFTLYPHGYNYFGAFVDYAGEYLGTIGNVDLVAAFLCIVIPVLWISILRRSEKIKYLLFIPLCLALLVLLWSHVDAALVGVFGGFFLSLPVVLPISKKKRALVGFCILGLVILGTLVLFCYGFRNGILHEVHEILHGRLNDKFGSKRIYIWRNVLALVPQHLWFGAGPDTLSTAMIKGFSRYLPRLDITAYASIDVAHNEYFNILYHQGIFALASYLGALIVSAIQWVKMGDNTAKAICGGAVLCYCIQGFFGISMCMTAPFLWISLALFNANTHQNT